MLAPIFIRADAEGEIGPQGAPGVDRPRVLVLPDVGKLVDHPGEIDDGVRPGRWRVPPEDAREVGRVAQGDGVVPLRSGLTVDLCPHLGPQVGPWRSLMDPHLRIAARIPEDLLRLAAFEIRKPTA